MTRLELILERREEGATLCSPEVGLFTCALAKGQVVVPGQPAGELKKLGVPHTLVVPAGATGRIQNERPERVHAPVGYGDALYVLEPVAAGEDAGALEEAGAEAEGPAVVAPHTGRFWRSPSPGEKAFVDAGDVLEEGATVGVIEVMKTFTQVRYQATSGLPKRARVTQVVAGDGDEVGESDVLFRIEPA